MCTILVLSRTHPSAGLVVLANRDEFYARPTEGPRGIDAATGLIHGRDLVGGGTWIGATESGFFVGVTNQRTFTGPDPALRSRGALAIEALERGSAEGVRALLAETDGRTLNSFNLVYGDARGVEVAYGRRERATIERRPLPPGLHVLANDRIGSPDFPKADRAAALGRGLGPKEGPELAAAARALLSDHLLPPLESVPEPPPKSIFDRELVRALQALCIHTPTYGTRSATLIAADELSLIEYRYADGPPCEAPLLPVFTRE